MKNILYQLMIRNARSYIDGFDPTATYSERENIPLSIWEISEVLAITTGKLKEDIVQDIITVDLSDKIKVESDVSVLKWIEITEENPAPRVNQEFLTKNERQGGIMNLAYWSNVHNHFLTEGKYIHENNVGTHYMIIPKNII